MQLKFHEFYGSGTVNIYNPMPNNSYYVLAFSNSGRFVVNYSSAVASIIDRIIASGGSRITKGVQLD